MENNNDHVKRFFLPIDYTEKSLIMDINDKIKFIF